MAEALAPDYHVIAVARTTGALEELDDRIQAKGGSATLAPMQYLEIPVATVLGLIFFEDLPDGLAAAGIALTVAAGLYIIWRERVTSRAQPA